MPAVADARRRLPRAEPPIAGPWDVVDLRRLRCGDPAADALAAAFGAREIAEGWTLNVEREDVCPVVDAARRAPTSTPTSRPSARRSATRSGARSAAPRPSATIRLDESADPLADLETFIDLHQKSGATTGCSPTRRAARRAACSSGACSSSTARTGRSGCRSCRSAAGASRPGSTSRRGDGYLYYNAGVDPAARDLSPGVLLVYALVERALAAGVRRLDFLRGNEPYKYEWGAVDEPIQRILVRRRNG